MRITLSLFIVMLLTKTSGAQIGEHNPEIDRIAIEYVKLGLSIGQYDPDFVDAYYGPDSLKPVGQPEKVFPKNKFLSEIGLLQLKLNAASNSIAAPEMNARAAWLKVQLRAFEARVRIFSGEHDGFEKESKALFNASVPLYNRVWFQQLRARLDSMLPGRADVFNKFQTLANKFIIPKAKLDTVFRTAITEARMRTKKHFKLPEAESFNLEYVKGKPWTGYNWYKGNYNSVIQLNTDTDMFIERAIDVASHESYPGHHVYNMLLEETLYRRHGWVEISLYPLFSPQSFIAEGTANYGIEMVFPGDAKKIFAKAVLLPLAGIDTTGVSLYFDALAVRGQMNFARNEVARGLRNKTLSRDSALIYLKEYCLMNEETAIKSLNFIEKYGSYVINYNYGQALVKNFVEKGGQLNMETRWERFKFLLTNPVLPADLENDKHK